MSVTAYAFQRLQHSPAPLRDAIISALRGAIEIGELRPGARLVERMLCEQLLVSRTSLREALRELVADGVIMQGQNRGLVVAMVSEEEARSVYSLRGAIQGLVIVEFMERADPTDREAFLAAAADLQSAYTLGNVAVILQAKRHFYACLCAGARNPIALSLIERLCLRVSSLRSRAPGRAARNAVSADEIGRIAAAAKDGDVALAKSAMLEHLASVAHWTLSTLHSDAAVDARLERPSLLEVRADL